MTGAYYLQVALRIAAVNCEQGAREAIRAADAAAAAVFADRSPDARLLSALAELQNAMRRSSALLQDALLQ